MLIRNTAANLAGQLLYPILSLLLVPLYIRHLGVEGYGLVGVMALVVSLLSVFSRGAGAALQREIGRRRGTPESHTLARLVRSIEVLHWLLGAVAALLLLSLALTVAPGWIRTEHIPARTLTICLSLLSLRVAAAFPHSVYHSVFIGTERQVLGSGLNALAALAAAAAAVVGVLLWQSVVAVFAAEALTAALFLPAFRSMAFRVLPAGVARFDSEEVRCLFRISVAMLWTSGVGLLLSNLDRVVVTAVLPVAALAVYTIAVLGGRLVTLVFGPFLQAAYPRMCETARSGSPLDQSRDLLRNTAVALVIAAGLGVPLAAFASEILVLWVRDPALAAAAAPVMSLYVVATVLLAFASVFYQWQTAIGRTTIAVRFNTFALVWFPPLLWLLVTHAGLAGGALAWAAYGALAWGTNIAATFGANGLPVSARREYFRLAAVTLVPAAAIGVAGRIAANFWFSETLAGRMACAAAAAACSALVALAIVIPRLGDDASSAPERPAAEAELSHGRL